MSDFDGSITFKDWLPDQPDLNNPGLTEAQNVIPISGTYRSYAPLSTTGNALASNVRSSIRAGNFLYAGISGALTGFLYRNTGTAGAWSLMSSTFSATGQWDMTQYEDYVIATNGTDSPVYQDPGGVSNFATLGSTSGSAPAARVVGVIGQFVVLGGLTVDQYAVQWSGIDAPLSWPTPSSATAIAQQSGRQTLDVRFGGPVGIYGGDQFGLILCTGGIWRMTYVGGDAVFQFDLVDKGTRAFYGGSVQAGNLIYLATEKGFYVTDGVQAQPIGAGQVNEYFLTRLDRTYEAVAAGVDYRRKLIYWAFAVVGDTGNPSRALVYHYEEKRWSLVVDPIRLFVKGNETRYDFYSFEAFGTDNKIGRFNGAPGTALLTTGEMEPNPGGFANELGIKPLVDQANITVAMGTRNDRTTTPTYSSEQTVNARSGFANFRTEARYHRARLTVIGTFNAAQGIEYQANAAGYL